MHLEGILVYGVAQGSSFIFFCMNNLFLPSCIYFPTDLEGCVCHTPQLNRVRVCFELSVLICGLFACPHARTILS